MSAISTGILFIFLFGIMVPAIYADDCQAGAEEKMHRIDVIPFSKSDAEITELLRKLDSVSLGMAYDKIIELYGNPDQESLIQGKAGNAPIFKYVHYYIYCKNPANRGNSEEKSLSFKFDVKGRLTAVFLDITISYRLGGDGNVWWKNEPQEKGPANEF